MEWVETTGRTIEEAKDLALDQLGVDEQEAEFEVVDEPKSGLLGRFRREARVRARVRPVQPRPKAERRRQGGRGGNRGRKNGAGSGGNSGDGGTSGRGGSTSTDRSRSRGKSSGGRPAKESGGRPAKSSEGRPARERPAKDQPRRPATDRPQQTTVADTGDSKGSTMGEDVTVEEQADIIIGFLEGLVDAFGYEAGVEQDRVDDETIELQVDGDDLGLMIGPKGQTLSSVQDLARVVVQRQASGNHEGRVRIDIGGYRLRRRAALERFAQQVAEEVLDSGVQKALEPMNAADRKVVHDTVNEIDGVGTVSEGQDADRRVVIIPEGQD